jgi:hypothetical protein
VLELSNICDCRDTIKKFGTGLHEQMKLFDINLRNRVVNEKQNLGFTGKFEDPEGYPLLPRSLRKSINIWTRVGDIPFR